MKKATGLCSLKGKIAIASGKPSEKHVFLNGSLGDLTNIKDMARALHEQKDWKDMAIERRKKQKEGE